MKDIRPKLIALFREGYCTPQIGRIAKTINEPASTIHYNIKKLEREGTIKTYKAVFNYKKIDEGFCVYLLIKLTAKAGAHPDKIAGDMAKYEEVESIDLLTGVWDMILKIRTKDQDEYYNLLKSILSREGIAQSMSMTSLRQLKTEFVLV